MPFQTQASAQPRKPIKSLLSDEVIRQRLRKADLRVTGARVRLMQIVSAGAMSADAVARLIFQEGGPFAVSTIYRSLAELEVAGLLIREVDADRKFTYRLKPGEAVAASCQFTCLETGQTVIFDDEEMRDRLGVLAHRHGMAVQSGWFMLKVRINAMPTPSEGRGHQKPIKKSRT